MKQANSEERAQQFSSAMCNRIVSNKRNCKTTELSFLVKRHEHCVCSHIDAVERCRHKRHAHLFRLQIPHCPADKVYHHAQHATAYQISPEPTLHRLSELNR